MEPRIQHLQIAGGVSIVFLSLGEATLAVRMLTTPFGHALPG